MNFLEHQSYRESQDQHLQQVVIKLPGIYKGNPQYLEL